jgi:hypothetical protein
MRYLVLATPGYIVFIDDALEVDWKTTNEWDEHHAQHREKFAAILNRAAAIESSDWDRSDQQNTLNFKRQIGEAIARGLDSDFENADEMLKKAEAYRQSTLHTSRRKLAIKDQVDIKNSWRRCFRGWTAMHYGLGTAALLMSTLVASKPIWLHEDQISLFAWLVAAFTGLLTFLTPDKKAGKYVRAWSVLNTEITRYNASDGHTIDDVLDAYHRGENILHEIQPSERRSRRINI